jgi:hypothetical protein
MEGPFLLARSVEKPMICRYDDMLKLTAAPEVLERRIRWTINSKN